jgi:molecular chaperone DnaK
MKIGEAVYKASAEAGAGPGAAPGAPPHDDKVVDADFEEIDDKKKKSA